MITTQENEIIFTNIVHYNTINISRRWWISKPSSIGWLDLLRCRGGITSCVRGGARLANISRYCTRRRVFLLNHDRLYPFSVFLGRLLIHMLSNTSCKVIHLQIRVLLSEDGHDATIGMPKSLVVLIVSLLL
ncbi:hypothetical protein CUMW_238450 [Citrus unshiu]|uniref:Uncharacterized protein n=1 Tax=Citrus unshiu TaxID=55188 RepID=A0A2H5QKC6_CITUN|nr:hypothetical protein CUMW_238450 [Citrus unshiu]